jgi:carboxypeptidase Taq
MLNKVSISPDSPLAYQELRARLAKIHDLDRVRALLEWDARTTMPEGGATARVEQIASVERSRHERFTDEEVGGLLEELRPYEESLPPESNEAALIRTARRDYEKSSRVPPGLNARLARAEARGQHIWEKARERSDFALLLPFLEEVIYLKREYIACFDAADPYDVLLDDFEPGLTTAEVARLLGGLKAKVAPLIPGGSDRDAVDDGFLHNRFPVPDQRLLAHALLALLPAKPNTLRLGESVHPVSTSIAIGDVRITTRYDEYDLGASLFPTLHEFGHALYESGVDPALERTPLADLQSLGLHESQSRIWENAVGRSLPFWRYFWPHVEVAFPSQLRGVTPEQFHRAVNKVQPSLIRVDSDELTYDLHIIMRFELERELFSGTLAPRDLPEAWAAKMRTYLGLDVPDDLHGVLQDIHWAEGAFGYFPTYSLGNVIAGQLWAAANDALPDLDEQIERGDFMPLRDWLHENVHRHGRKLTSAEIVKRVTGGPIETGPYVAYLRDKVEQVYRTPAGAR